MAIRAYKIAEEIGLDRNEFVDKARELGIELKSAMASVDESQAEMLREKLGGKREAVTEARVEAGSGTGKRSVIRRRKKVVPEEAAPVAVVAASAKPAEDVVAAGAAPPVEAPVLERVPAPELERAAPEPSEPAPVEPVMPGGPLPDALAPAAEPGGAKPGPRPATEKPAAERAPDRKGRQRKQFKEVVNLREQEQLARQVTSRGPGRYHPPVSADSRAFSNPRRRRRDAHAQKPAAAAVAKEPRRLVRIDNEISVAELAKQLGVKAAQLQGKLMSLGTMVAVNQAISMDVAAQVAKEYDFEVQNVGFQESEFLGDEAAAADETGGAAQPRPPVVTVMGHVDHGKTSLLDALRDADVVAGEAGGITQHIGAYQVQVGDSKLTFIDTPGHAAFTAMRARGAGVTDVVVLVVAASEGIMPQTVEAIDHAKAAGVPIVVAVNKCDLPAANPQQTRQRLMEHSLVTEEFGGDVLAVDVSATKKTGLDKLLEAIHLQAELLELKADPARRAQGVVLEARLDKGRGPVATVLVQNGTLRRGDPVVVGTIAGRVRSMQNERGEVVKEAGPSAPVQVIGLSGVPAAGEGFHSVENERLAKQIASNREDEARKKPATTRPRVTLEDLFASAGDDGPKELSLIIKADTDGSAEALKDSLLKIESDKVNLDVIHTAVGAITESDVQLAQASRAIIVGFHVRPDPSGRKAAESMGVDVRTYQIIYEVIDEVRAAMAGLLSPTHKEVFLGRAEVRDTFTIPRVGTIAGCYVQEGTMRRNASCRLTRDGVQIFEGKFSSLKRFKDDVREVQQSFECGVGLENFNDIKVGDNIEAFELEEQPANL
jgi:translation initiation factor IF-2